MKLCFLYSGLTRTLNHSISILKSLIPTEIEYDIAIHITSEDEDKIYLNRNIHLSSLHQNIHIKYILFDTPIQVPRLNFIYTITVLNYFFYDMDATHIY